MMSAPSAGQSVEGWRDFESECTAVVSTPELSPPTAMPPDFARRVTVVGFRGFGMVGCSGSFADSGAGLCVQARNSLDRRFVVAFCTEVMLHRAVTGVGHGPM